MISLRPAVAVATVLLAVVPAGPAAAAASEPKRWVIAKCLQASLSTAVTYEPDVEHITVTGTATDCQTPTSTTYPVGFGVAAFDQPNGFGTILDWNIRTFPTPANPWQPTPVSFGAAAVPAHTGQYGVCVVYRPTAPPDTPIWVTLPARPAACVLVTVTRAEQSEPTVTTAPLPTDSPMLSRGAIVPTTYTGPPCRTTWKMTTTATETAAPASDSCAMSPECHYRPAVSTSVAVRCSGRCTSSPAGSVALRDLWAG
jgi:hypothetical protein